jgi:hypothetical protein
MNRIYAAFAVPWLATAGFLVATVARVHGEPIPLIETTWTGSDAE